MKFKEILSTRR